MRVLILGGTVFVGRHLAEAALARGHDVTLFNRGNHPEVLPGVARIRGDRDGGLGALAGGRWDAVIDTSGYLPRVVGDAVRALRDAAPRYAFVSTISVYAEPFAPRMDEDAALVELDDPTVEEVRGDTYGGLKALCEGAVRGGYPDAHLIVRPGIVVGPHDPTDRFTYWVRRLAQGGEALVPDARRQPLQWIDARDLAAWTVEGLERDLAGTFHLTTPAGRDDFGTLVAACREAGGDAATPAWVDEAFLLERGVRPFADLPLWLPDAQAELFRLDAGRAEAAGLAARPTRDTVAATLAWDRTRGDAPLRTGPTREREAELLAAWRGR